MAYTPRIPDDPAPDRLAPAHSFLLLGRAAVALKAIAGTEWLAARYPRYDVVAVSLARVPATSRKSPLAAFPGRI